MRGDRYIGDVQPGGMTEIMKQQMIAAAPNMTDGQAGDLLEIVDATKLGSRTKWTRYGLGAAVGAVVGFVIASKFGKKR